MGAFLGGIVLTCMLLLPEESIPATANGEISNIVLAQSIAAREHHPEARLFQVFLPDFVPEPKLTEARNDVEVHSYFETTRTQEFLETITTDSKAINVIARPFEGHSCFHGYPASRSEACLATVQAPGSEDDYLGLNWTLNLPKLAAALRENGIDPEKHFDITIISARRIIETWRLLNVQTGSDVRARLDKERSREAIVSATEHFPAGHGGGATWLFRATDYECLGSISIGLPVKSPPTHLPAPH